MTSIFLFLVIVSNILADSSLYFFRYFTNCMLFARSDAIREELSVSMLETKINHIKKDYSNKKEIGSSYRKMYSIISKMNNE